MAWVMECALRSWKLAFKSAIKTWIKCKNTEEELHPTRQGERGQSLWLISSTT